MVLDADEIIGTRVAHGQQAMGARLQREAGLGSGSFSSAQSPLPLVSPPSLGGHCFERRD